MNNKRKYKRIESPYTTRFRVKEYEGQELPSSEGGIVAVKNLSAGGMVFNYSKNLEFGSLLDLKMNISKTMPTIKCIGKVIRIKKSSGGSTFSIAAKFTEINEQEKEMINKTIEENLRNETAEKNSCLGTLKKVIYTMTGRVAR